MLTIHQQIVVIRNTVSLLFETVPLPPVNGEQKLRNHVCQTRNNVWLTSWNYQRTGYYKL